MEIPCSKGSRSQEQYPKDSLDGAFFFIRWRRGKVSVWTWIILCYLASGSRAWHVLIYCIMKWQREGEWVMHENWIPWPYITMMVWLHTALFHWPFLWQQLMSTFLLLHFVHPMSCLSQRRKAGHLAAESKSLLLLFTSNNSRALLSYQNGLWRCTVMEDTLNLCVVSQSHFDISSSHPLHSQISTHHSTPSI